MTLWYPDAHKICTWFYSALLWLHMYPQILVVCGTFHPYFSRFASLALGQSSDCPLGQSDDCPSASEEILRWAMCIVIGNDCGSPLKDENWRRRISHELLKMCELQKCLVRSGVMVTRNSFLKLSIIITFLILWKHLFRSLNHIHFRQVSLVKYECGTCI